MAKLFDQKSRFDEESFSSLETALIGADVGVATAEKLISKLKEKLENSSENDTKTRKPLEYLKHAAIELFESSRHSPRPGTSPSQPEVWLIVGVNGVGKTTTVAKIANDLKQKGKTVVLGAADTFRAAAVGQLKAWAERTNCTVISGSEQSDPGSVAFDTVKHAKTTPTDIAIIDTAGRLHTKANLMEELRKIAKSAEKAAGHPLAEILLVVDATNGQNALQQARLFSDILPITGVVLSKLDGTAKGGITLAIADQLKLPIRYIGIGEGLNDFQAFEASTFVDALFESNDTPNTSELNKLNLSESA
ncbi:MAG: signal recognition particle-docking protein FtsY [Myxococcales bacterium]|nr:MAG: signal recognition particle-docking protein FtsY [Myxococcales bacterium]